MRCATNFRAEAMALNTAAAEIPADLDKTHKKVVFFSNALPVLHALQIPQKKELNNLTSVLSQLNDRVKVTLQWIPAHCWIHGNESADILEKEGSGLDQHKSVSYKDEKTIIRSLTARKWHQKHTYFNPTEVSYKDEKTIIRSLTARKWHQKHTYFNPTDGYHYLGKADQVILIRLRTGHSRMNAYMYSKLKIGQTDRCWCDTAPMTSHHLLQGCSLQDVVRRETWPKDTSEGHALWWSAGSAEPATFVRTTGVSI